jgi:DNA polymerase/3'-5' exonuclease PolX
MEQIQDFKDIIIDALEIMRKKEVAEKGPASQFKVRAYQKVIKQLKEHETPIRDYADVKEIDGIGEKIALKIKEILETGQLKAAERTKKEMNIDAYDSLLKVYGVGPVKAKQLIKDGITSIAELRKVATTHLNDKQLIGLQYYDDLLERIPRKEMYEHEKVLKEGLPNFLTGELVGSFRRLAETSGDIDIIIKHTDKISPKMAVAAFHKYISNLTSNGYITDTLALGDKKCMAVCRASGEHKARRLDLLLTSEREYPYAILYFTGSDKFNVAFRQHALDHGYTLNEHSMAPLTSKAITPIGIKEEEDIFDFLGLQYVEPCNRTGPESLIEN